MAQKTIVTLLDDIDGSEATTTLSFAFDGKSYVIDLNDKNAAAFEKAIEPYLSAARRTTPGAPSRGRRRADAGGPSANDIRAWAKENGLTVSERGRISQEVRDAYNAAH